ncbi:hypothetical protein [Yoonia sp.]|uniref:hypothetical protein n=1 Tax=Yoonia sp. TaxID=2212373 RepID=UPI001A0B392D|nr:hypothetical protein [Yoonia sp.]MBE0412494.1 hypothetical protein [Yoonia sp.]
MMRFILLILLVAAVLIAFTAVLGTMQALATKATGRHEDKMPVTFRKIAYILLVILMIGVSAGWLGAG